MRVQVNAEKDKEEASEEEKAEEASEEEEADEDNEFGLEDPTATATHGNTALIQP